jgi:transcriptional regulator with GAF, ATPase, and Fis domain
MSTCRWNASRPKSDDPVETRDGLRPRAGVPEPGVGNALPVFPGELERRRVVEALAAAGGVQKRAAELIMMPLRTFRLKSKQYGISLRVPEK